MYRLRDNTVDQIEEQESEKKTASFVLYDYQIEILEELSGDSKSSLMRNILHDVLGGEKLDTDENRSLGTKLAIDRLEELYVETSSENSIEAIEKVEHLLLENSYYR